jgi:hypothetical protein
MDCGTGFRSRHCYEREFREVTAAADLNYPIFTWDGQHIFRAQSYKALTYSSSGNHRTLNKLAAEGKDFLIDSDGFKYRIVSYERLTTGVKLIDIFSQYRIEPILVDKVLLSLEDFKSAILRAIRLRDRYNFDSYTLVDTKAPLDAAKTYREAIMSLPKVY